MSESDDPYGTLKPAAKAPRARPVIRHVAPAPLVPVGPVERQDQESLLPIAEAELDVGAERPEASILVEVAHESIAEARPAAKLAPPPRPAQQSAPRRAATVARLCLLGTEARARLDEKQLVLPFLYRLMNERLYLDVARFLAHALPVAVGVKWACACAEEAQATAQSDAALLAAMEWIEMPSQGNRWACGSAAKSAGYGTAAGSAALAAFLSGGSIVAADRPAVQPKEGVAGQAIGNAVLLTALLREPERLLQYLKNGIGLLVNLGEIPLRAKSGRIP